MSKKNIYIYSEIGRYTAQRVAEELDEAVDTSVVRINSGGGNVVDGAAIIYKLSQLSLSKATVDGRAMSMAAFMLSFFKDVEAHSMSEIMFHKAAYPSWYEPTAEEQIQLKDLNTLLKKQMEARGINQAFIDKVFNPDIREDCYLTPQEALEYGVINSIKELTPEQIATHDANASAEIAASARAKVAAFGKEKNPTKIKSTQMTKAEFLASNPSVYAEIAAEAVVAEKERTQAFLAYLDTEGSSSAARAIKAIKDNESVIATMPEMMNLKMADMKAQQMEAENESGVDAEATTPGGDKGADVGKATMDAAIAEAKKRKGSN